MRRPLSGASPKPQTAVYAETGDSIYITRNPTCTARDPPTVDHTHEPQDPAAMQERRDSSGGRHTRGALAEKKWQEAEIARCSDKDIQCIFDLIFDIIFRVFDLVVLVDRSDVLREQRCSAAGNESAAQVRVNRGTGIRTCEPLNHFVASLWTSHGHRAPSRGVPCARSASPGTKQPPDARRGRQVVRPCDGLATECKEACRQPEQAHAYMAGREGRRETRRA